MVIARNAARSSVLALLLIGFLAPAHARADLNAAKQGDIIAVQLDQLHPTQPSVGYDQVYYKLGRYRRDREKHFDEICENNGAKAVTRFTRNSSIRDLSSFECEEAVGSRPNEMKTVVLAPNGKAYLTDGHHTFNVYWLMDGGGPDFVNHVVVDKDYRQLPDMKAFWAQMEADGNVWLHDHVGQPITPADLPPSLGLEHFGNDVYRALMYFSRGIAWHKPERITNPATGERYPSIPFVEFYWSRELRKGVDLSQHDLNSRAGYNRAIRAVADFILKFESDDVGGSGRSAQSMGRYEAFNQNELDRINRPGRGKLIYTLEYKKALEKK